MGHHVLFPNEQFLRAEEHRTAGEVPAGRSPCSQPYHVSQAHGPALGMVLHQGVVVSGEQRPAADPLRQLLHHRARYGRAVKRGRASAWGHKGTPVAHSAALGAQKSQSPAHVLLDRQTSYRQCSNAFVVCVSSPPHRVQDKQTAVRGESHQHQGKGTWVLAP